MRRTKLVLAAAAVMVAMLVAFSAPAMANERNDQRSFSNISDNNNHDRFFGNDCCNNNNNNDDDAIIFTSFGGHGEDFFDDFDDFDDGDNFSALFAGGCWEWSWVFEEWEWEEDCD